MQVTVVAIVPQTHEGRWISPGDAMRVTPVRALILKAQGKVSLSRSTSAVVPPPPPEPELPPPPAPPRRVIGARKKTATVKITPGGPRGQTTPHPNAEDDRTTTSGTEPDDDDRERDDRDAEISSPARRAYRRTEAKVTDTTHMESDED